MVWRIFSVVVGICSYVALALGVSSSRTTAPVMFVGYLGAVFVAVAVGSCTASLRSDRRSRPSAARRTETTVS